MDRHALHVRLAGGVEVSSPAGRFGGADLPGRQGRLAFARLAIEEGAIARDELADLLWPGLLPKSWERDLSAVLSKVRAALSRVGGGRDTVSLVGGAYELHLPPGSTVDVVAARRCVERDPTSFAPGPRPLAELESAVATLRQVFLPGEASDWADRIRDENRSWLRRALELTAELHANAGALSRALDAAERALEVDPFHEPSYVNVMRLQVRTGNRSAAVRTYERCRSVLRTELDVEPSPETEAAYDEVRHSKSPKRRPGPPSVLNVNDLPFVGRDDELERLRTAWKRTRTGERQVVFVTGEPGIGKTRLLGELARTVYAEGEVVLYGRCDADPVVPYQPFSEALRAYAAVAGNELSSALGDATAYLARLVPELEALTQPPPDADPEVQRFRLFDAVVRALALVSRGGLLVLDDLQWAARPTGLLLRHAARADLPLLIAVTGRDTEMPAELVALVAELEREPEVQRIELSGLDPEEVEMLAGLTLPGEREVTAPGARTLHGTTGGNPFFVTELLRADEARGGVPRTIRDAVIARLDRLSPEAVALLTVGALVGRTFPPEVVELVGEVADATARIAEAVRAGFLVERADGDLVAFSHDIMREVIASTVGARERSRLHQRIAEAIETCAPQAAASIALHLSAGGSASSRRLAIHSLAASRLAMDRFAFEDAVAAAQDALAAAPRGRDDAGLVADILLQLGEAHFAAGDREKARASALRSADTAQALGSPVRVARAAILYYGRAAVLGHPDPPLVDMCQYALQALPPEERALRARVLATLAEHCYSAEGKEAEGRQLAEEALALSRSVDDVETLAFALWVWAVTMDASPDLDSVAERVAELVELTAAEGAALRQVDPLFMQARLHLVLGDVPAADECIRRLHHVSSATGSWSARCHVSEYNVVRAMFDGRFADAEREIDAGQVRFGAMSPNAANIFMAQRVYLGLERGVDVVPVLNVIAEAMPGIKALRALLALAQARAGAFEGARANLHVLLDDDLACLPRDVTWTASLAAAAETCGLLGDVAAAPVILDKLRPHAGSVVVAAAVVACVGAVDRYLGILAACEGRLDDALDHHRRALEIEERMCSAPLVARTGLWQARALRSRGRPGDQHRAQEILGAVVETAQRLGMRMLEEEGLAVKALTSAGT